MQVALLGLRGLRGLGHQEGQRRGEEGSGGVPWGLGWGAQLKLSQTWTEPQDHFFPWTQRKCSGLSASDLAPFLPSLSALPGQ